MKIKEVEQLTGITSHTIRYYEEQGLIQVERENNLYRTYSKENIEQLQLIKILRSIDIPISDIKEYFEGKQELNTLVELQLTSLNNKLLIENEKKSICLSILNDKSFNQEKILEQIEFLESNDFKMLNEIFMEFKQTLFTQIMGSLMALGPILWSFFYYIDNQYELLKYPLCLSVLSIIYLTLSWRSYLVNRKEIKRENKKTGLLLVATIVSIFILLAPMVVFSVFLEKYLLPDNYIMYANPTYVMIGFMAIGMLFFLAFFSKIYKISNNVAIKHLDASFQFLKQHKKITISVLIVILYICITNITIITNDEIIVRSSFHPTGIHYQYDDVELVEAGFRDSSFFYSHKGEFYYYITIDSHRINLSVPSTNEEEYYDDTYIELEDFHQIMKEKEIEISVSQENSEYCDYDDVYVERFLRITQE